MKKKKIELKINSLGTVDFQGLFVADCEKRLENKYKTESQSDGSANQTLFPTFQYPPVSTHNSTDLLQVLQWRDQQVSKG